MTTNQTIDGVPRAWLEEYESLADLTSGDAQMLRGLLDAPEPLWNPHAANLAALLIKLAQQGIKVSGAKAMNLGKWNQPPSLKPSSPRR